MNYPESPDTPASDTELSDNQASDIQGSDTRKLHLSAIPIWMVDNTRSLLTGLLPLALGTQIHAFFLWLLLVPAVASLAGPLFKYLRFRYEITPQTLIVEGGGVFKKWRRVIPTERIQSIDVIQKLRHRVFGVVELRIEVIGGSSTEAQMVALKPAEADRVRALALGEGTSLASAEVSADASGSRGSELARLRTKDLLMAGLTGGRVAFLAVLILNLEQILPEEDFFERALESAAGGRAAWLGFVVIGVLVLLTSVVGSLVLTVLTYWDFTVKRQNGDLLVVRGLLSTRRSTIPLARIQAIHVRQNFLRRLFGLASLSVVVAGYSSSRRQGEQSADVNTTLLPLAKLSDAYRVAEQILGVPTPFSATTLMRSPARAFPYSAIKFTLLSLVASGAVLVASAVGFAVPSFAPYGGLFIFVMGVSAGYLAWRIRKYGFTSTHVIRQSGVLGKKTTIVPLVNLQHTNISIGPLQRAMRLTTVNLSVPKLRLSLHSLDRAAANGIFQSLNRARTER